MFNLLVKSSPWSANRDIFWASRVFEYTEPQIQQLFTSNQSVDFDKLLRLPTLFAEETDRTELQMARVGRIVEVRKIGGDEISLEYFFDPAIPPIPQAELIRLAPSLGVQATRYGPPSFSRTHWAVKDIDLFHLLLTQRNQQTRTPSVFSLEQSQTVDNDLLSAMMPFAGFDGTWNTIQRVAIANGMRSGRADNFWEHHAIIQDIVSLIDRSAIVICDCSSRNANVFYEMGIAHSFGKEVILITQNPADIPFDIAHHRYIRYLNNGEGHLQLERELSARVATLQAQRANSRT
ncbi:hypothetical protein IQK56_00810 [Pseudomonas sp. MAFF 301449]|uniref:Uncharacterized protein n=1 Tax=Pseudomonas cyclaminis TaxID=2781239 RepID=A0ABR9SKZ5_9PSED|nr:MULTISPECIES: hypothetical protein [Pseudomonas]MBE8589586.1 hypothetical protein [Pseudomonas cyclaminis]MBE8598753.1 hypothetical protein [Pseudomonas cyclaminis]